MEMLESFNIIKLNEVIINTNLSFQLYDNIKAEFFNNHGAMEVPLWASDVVVKTSLPSKL